MAVTLNASRYLVEGLILDAMAEREPKGGGCCDRLPGGQRCEDHAADQRLHDQYARILADLRDQRT